MICLYCKTQIPSFYSAVYSENFTMSSKTRYNKGSHLHGQAKKHQGRYERDAWVLMSALCLQRWLKPLLVFRRMEISGDTWETLAIGPFRLLRKNSSLGTVGESGMQLHGSSAPGASLGLSWDGQPVSPSAALCG